MVIPMTLISLSASFIVGSSTILDIVVDKLSDECCVKEVVKEEVSWMIGDAGTKLVIVVVVVIAVSGNTISEDEVEVDELLWWFNFRKNKPTVPALVADDMELPDRT